MTISTIINILEPVATKSTIDSKMAAVLMNGCKPIGKPQYNKDKITPNSCSEHAETAAITNYYRCSLTYHLNSGWVLQG